MGGIAKDHNGMTLKQKLFCQHYLSNGYNASKAARDAGYTDNENVSRTIGSENMAKPAIKKYIEARMKEAIEKAGVGLEWRLNLVKLGAEAASKGLTTKDGTIDSDGIYKGVDLLNRMDGSFAPTKSESKMEVAEIDSSKVDALIEEHAKDA